jgi:hypothetical protein
MGELDLLHAVDARLVETKRRQQLIEQQPCAGIVIAVDEAHLAGREVGKRVDVERVAALDHQPHLAGHEADDAVVPRIEPFPAGLDSLCA